MLRLQFEVLLLEGAPEGRLEKCPQARLQELRGKLQFHASLILTASSFPNQIAKNDILGRFMVAKRNIKAGDVIVREPPLVLGPKISSIVMCLGCHRTINPPKSGDYFKCSGCTWPLCGSSCESLPAHVEECQLMRQKKFNSSIKNCGAPKIEAAYCVITPLRVILLKKTNPKAFKTIMELTSNLDQRIDTKLYGALRVNLVPFIRSFLGLTDFTETDVLNIAGILDTNTFDVVLPAKQTRLRGIYPISAMLAGGCVPNTKHFVDENFEMKVIACVPIKKGEMILTSYTHPLKTTIERKHQIREAKCFDCICPRCNDPSEMKTFVSGVRCKSCSVGIQVPVDLIRWQCSECFKEISSKEATEILKNARSSLEALNKKSIADCEKFLRSFLVVLPPTSVFMIDVKYSLSLLYGNVSGFMIEGDYLRLADINTADLISLFLRFIRSSIG